LSSLSDDASLILIDRKRPVDHPSSIISARASKPLSWGYDTRRRHQLKSRTKTFSTASIAARMAGSV
ncbi:hypothetical protein ACXHMN_06420, partial [Rhizobium sp. LEGMi12c]